nr:hypothetical protein ISGA_07470 [Gordonia sp. NB41Y]
MTSGGPTDDGRVACIRVGASGAGFGSGAAGAAAAGSAGAGAAFAAGCAGAFAAAGTPDSAIASGVDLFSEGRAASGAGSAAGGGTATTGSCGVGVDALLSGFEVIPEFYVATRSSGCGTTGVALRFHNVSDLQKPCVQPITSWT